MDWTAKAAAQTRRQQNRLKKFVSLGASIVISLGCVEVGLRIVWDNPYRHEGPDRVVTLRLQHANTNHQFNRAAIHPESPHAQLRTNDRSYILPCQQFENPDCTIAFVGGSTTECCAVAENLRFPAVVSKVLSEKGLKVNTLNAGTSGTTLHDSINNLLNHVIQDQPDFVVLMHACNDVGVLSEKGSYAARSGKLVGWSDIVRMSLMRLSSYSSFLGLTRNVARERLFYQPTHPEEFKPRPASEASDELDGMFQRRLRAFVRVGHALGVQPVIMTQPLSNHFTSLAPDWTDHSVQFRFNELIRKVGREEDVIVIDLVRHLETNVPRWDEHMKLFYDGMHVNDNGSRIYGEHIAERLLPVVLAMSNHHSTESLPSGESDPRANRSLPNVTR